MLRHLTRPYGIVALILVAFTVAWAVWTFVWLPQADVRALEPTRPAGNGTSVP